MHVFHMSNIVRTGGSGGEVEVGIGVGLAGNLSFKLTLPSTKYTGVHGIFKDRGGMVYKKKIGGMDYKKKIDCSKKAYNVVSLTWFEFRPVCKFYPMILKFDTS